MLICEHQLFLFFSVYKLPHTLNIALIPCHEVHVKLSLVHLGKRPTRTSDISIHCIISLVSYRCGAPHS